ncbi:hypothetical protein PVAP13_3KG139400 [Panicum virgatum]|uniref:Uncharacterized protein n=1 Tax=Panicum virgatum TaxID=38727 RepID=A0A8T0UTN5_PANVG|nr:hypothetical protein PVAP13_3KG139400 [Panicum virgatum]
MKDGNRTASIVRGAGPWKLTGTWARWNGSWPIELIGKSSSCNSWTAGLLGTPSDRRPATFAGWSWRLKLEWCERKTL